MGHDLTSMINAYRTAHIAELGNKSDIEVIQAMLRNERYSALQAWLCGAISEKSSSGKGSLAEKHIAEGAMLPLDSKRILSSINEVVAFISNKRIFKSKTEINNAPNSDKVNINQNFYNFVEATKDLDSDLQSLFTKFEQKRDSFSPQKIDLAREIVAQLKAIKEGKKVDDNRKTELLKKMIEVMLNNNRFGASVLTKILAAEHEKNSVEFNTEVIEFLDFFSSEECSKCKNSHILKSITKYADGDIEFQNEMRMLIEDIDSRDMHALDKRSIPDNVDLTVMRHFIIAYKDSDEYRSDKSSLLAFKDFSEILYSHSLITLAEYEAIQIQLQERIISM